MNSFTSDIKKLCEEVREKVEARSKNSKKDTRKNNPFFTRKLKISNELCDILNVTHGTKETYTRIVSGVSKYISDNHLQSPEDRRIIIPDDKLSKVVSLGRPPPYAATEPLTYYNLERALGLRKSDMITAQPGFLRRLFPETDGAAGGRGTGGECLRCKVSLEGHVCPFKPKKGGFLSSDFPKGSAAHEVFEWLESKPFRT